MEDLSALDNSKWFGEILLNRNKTMRNSHHNIEDRTPGPQAGIMKLMRQEVRPSHVTRSCMAFAHSHAANHLCATFFTIPSLIVRHGHMKETYHLRSSEAAWHVGLLNADNHISSVDKQ